MKIVVAGAQGKLGKLIVEALHARSKAKGQDVQIVGLARRKDDQSSASGVVATDYSEQELARLCEGAHTVVSALQGLEDVIVGVQSSLLRAAIACKVSRFIPSDFSLDFTNLPDGLNRNLDLRRHFHREAEAIIAQTGSRIQLTSLYQGGFTELLASGWVVFNYEKRQVVYFGQPDAPSAYTTWKNTAEYTAAVAMDANETPRSLHIAGTCLTPQEAVDVAKRATGADFALSKPMPLWALRAVIVLLRFFKPGEPGDLMPIWQGMQYAYCGALPEAAPKKELDNDRYDGIEWTGPEQIVQEAFKQHAEKMEAKQA